MTNDQLLNLWKYTEFSFYACISIDLVNDPVYTIDITVADYKGVTTHFITSYR
jgi:hypothetical protein